MRPIKFRAWDEEAEQMFYSDKPFEDDGNYFFEFKSGKLRGFAMRPPRPSSDPMEPPEPYCDDYPVEQFTGLCDKNSKEIYGGDIVVSSGVCPQSGKEYAWNCRIEYFQDGFCLKHHGGTMEGCLCLYRITDALRDGEYFGQIEVIGNIHSNPELIKEEK